MKFVLACWRSARAINGATIKIMTRENILDVLKIRVVSRGLCCECEIEIARNIGADYVISGELTKLGLFVFRSRCETSKTIVGNGTFENQIGRA